MNEYKVSVTAFGQLGSQTTEVTVSAALYDIDEHGTLHFYEDTEEGTNPSASFAPGKWNSVQAK